MKLWDLSGYSEKNNIQEAYLPKTRISGQIVSEILAQLCSDDSMQILLNLTWVKTFRPKSNMRLLAVNNKSFTVFWLFFFRFLLQSWIGF